MSILGNAGHSPLGLFNQPSRDEVDRLYGENARLRAALQRCRDMVGHPDNIAFIDAALDGHEQQSPKEE